MCEGRAATHKSRLCGANVFGDEVAGRIRAPVSVQEMIRSCVSGELLSREHEHGAGQLGVQRLTHVSGSTPCGIHVMPKIHATTFQGER